MSGPVVENLVSISSFISPSGEAPLLNMTLSRICTASGLGSEPVSLAISVTKSWLVTMMPALLLPVMTLSSMITSSPDITIIPLPAGICDTSEPGMPKFGVLLSITKLRRMMAS